TAHRCGDLVRSIGAARPSLPVASGAMTDHRESRPADPSVSPQREANVVYANALMDTEIGQRNARKDSQEATARWIVASTGIVMTLLLGLAKDEGVFSSSASGLAR